MSRSRHKRACPHVRREADTSVPVPMCVAKPTQVCLSPCAPRSRHKRACPHVRREADTCVPVSMCVAKPTQACLSPCASRSRHKRACPHVCRVADTSVPVPMCAAVSSELISIKTFGYKFIAHICRHLYLKFLSLRELPDQYIYETQVPDIVKLLQK